ncbi:MAG: DsbA family oxidoreductase [Acidimicrobiales bacterium]
MDVIEYTDAMCSWAWGSEPKLRLLRWRFDDQIDSWRRVMGHLVEDEYMPDRDRVADAPKLEEYWKVVCDQTDMPRPAPLHRSTAGSRASGLTVKAAQLQGEAVVDQVLRRMREATFVDGQPPDTLRRAIEACANIDGLHDEALAAAAHSDDVADAYQRDLDETRTPNDDVLRLEGERPGIGKAREAKDGRMRFVFPTVVVRSTDHRSSPLEVTVPGWMPYEDYERALFATGARPTDRTRSRPTPAEAFERWPSLADHELRFLCGADATPPPHVTTHTWAGGTIHTVGQATRPGRAGAR